MPGPSILNTPVTNWRDSVSTDLRLNLVHKFVQAMVPGTQKSALNEPRMMSVVAHAKEIENSIFEMAVSRADYYHMLAQKVYQMTKELERRREARRNEKTFEDITKKLRNM